MIQPDLFDPATWGAPLPLGPWVNYVIEEREHPRPHVGPVDPHLPLGACCVYKITNIVSGKAYIGKTVKPLELYIQKSHKKRKGIMGKALRKYGRAAFRSEILLVGTEDFCFRDVIDGNHGGMERALITAYGTRVPNGYNLRDGGEGMTSDDAKRLANWRANTPEGKAHLATLRSYAAEASSRKAGYPKKRLLALLEAAGPEGIRVQEPKMQGALERMHVDGDHTINDHTTGLYRLCTVEEGAEDWATRGEKRLKITGMNHVLGDLMRGPKDLRYFLGQDITPSSICHSLDRLQKRYLVNIKFHHGLYHLIEDNNQPWLHVGAMLHVRRALDDETMEVYNTEPEPEPEAVPIVYLSDTVLDLLREAGPNGMTINAIVEALGLTKTQSAGVIQKLMSRGGHKITKARGHGKPYILLTE